MLRFRGTSVALLLCAALTSCGDSSSGEFSSDEAGFSVTVPGGWHHAARPVDGVTTNPRELFVLSTFDVPRYLGPAQGCGPFYDHALSHMHDDQALVAVRERLGNEVAGPDEFPARPASFELKPVEPEAGGCEHRDARRRFRRWWIMFEDGGRDFYAQVDMGLGAPDSLREDAQRALDSMKLR